jgi:RimJ/RimL family protein N-acetyltransferase
VACVKVLYSVNCLKWIKKDSFYGHVCILEHELIELQPFTEGGFKQLISEIPDARFLLQWAGPKYTYPLDAAQLTDTLANTLGDRPSFKVFKVIRSETMETVGHIQLMDIDYNAASCILGRVLIFQKYRGNGFGKMMVKEAVKFAFENMHLAEIILGVFDFNTRAIHVYKSIGFTEFQFKKGARQFLNESWNVIRMKLNRINWSHTNYANNSIE